MQDNNSDILLEKNGKFYISKWTKHTKNVCLFETERVSHVELETEHYPMERMWDSIFTKPLQGRSCREFREELMNLTVDYEDENPCEYVGNTTGVSVTNTYIQEIPMPGIVHTMNPIYQQ